MPKQKSTKPLIDLTGQRFTRLIVIEPAERLPNGTWKWKCRCDCGKIKTILAASLRNGATKSCGCIRTPHRKHGMYLTPVYNVWSAMLQRCRSPKYPQFADYGGRGIEVCERWHQFENFLADMGDRPSPQHSLDRINNDGNYEPSNCRWATRSEQQRNRRANLRLTVNGVTRTAAEWAELRGFKHDTIPARLRYGWSAEDAVLQPVSHKQLYKKRKRA